jgi:hypothetical protein
VPGEDFIVAELFENSGQSLFEALHKIIVSRWVKEVMPKEWNNDLICPIIKEGDKLECKNYGGITLLNIAYEVLSCIILEHIIQHAECSRRIPVWLQAWKKHSRIDTYYTSIDGEVFQIQH